MAKKIIAKSLGIASAAPDVVGDEYYNGITVLGNPDYPIGVEISISPLINHLEDIRAAVEDGEDVSEMLIAYSLAQIVFASAEDVKAWTDVLAIEDDRDRMVAAIRLYTGKETYDWREICGSVQREYQTIYYDRARYSEDDIDQYEVAYWHLGTEYIVYGDGEESSYYYADDDIARKELAEEYGVKEEDVIICYGDEDVERAYADYPLNGMRVAVTGRMSKPTYPRDKVESLIDKLGGDVVEDVKDANLLIVGNDGSSDKVATAAKYGIRVMGELEFLRLVGDNTERRRIMSRELDIDGIPVTTGAFLAADDGKVVEILPFIGVGEDDYADQLSRYLDRVAERDGDMVVAVAPFRSLYVEPSSEPARIRKVIERR